MHGEPKNLERYHDQKIWHRPVLSAEQQVKCALLDIQIFVSGTKHPFLMPGLYAAVHCQWACLRPKGYVVGDELITKESIDEIIVAASDPDAFGAKWEWA